LEKNIINVQTGILGLWINDEFRLDEQISLRVEGGLNLGYFVSYNFGNRYVLAPTFTLEPRWYYNLDKRINEGKRINNNSGNFLGIKINYTPDWFVISDIDNYSVANQISVVPKWGARRTIGNTNFNFEFGGGIGYKYVFFKNSSDDSRVAVDIHVRIGYTFK
jgi:hypothetical protein